MKKGGLLFKQLRYFNNFKNKFNYKKKRDFYNNTNAIMINENGNSNPRELVKDLDWKQINRKSNTKRPSLNEPLSPKVDGEQFFEKSTNISQSSSSSSLNSVQQTDHSSNSSIENPEKQSFIQSEQILNNLNKNFNKLNRKKSTLEKCDTDLNSEDKNITNISNGVVYGSKPKEELRKSQFVYS